MSVRAVPAPPPTPLWFSSPLGGADQCTVTNWELNRTSPALRFIPALARFLGYLPLPAGGTLAERLVAYPTARGLSQEAAARLLGVDPGTLSR